MQGGRDVWDEKLTGGKRKTHEARVRQREMQMDARAVRQALRDLGVTADGGRLEWHRRNELPRVDGDRDIVAFNRKLGRYVIAEVEGMSSGQPEQKLYIPKWVLILRCPHR